MATLCAKKNRPLKRVYKHVTKELIDQILKDIKEGGTIKHSCEANMLTESMFHDMIIQAEYDLEEDKFDTLEAYLLKSLRKIQLVQIQNNTTVINESERGHRGKEWILERMHWRQFGSNLEARELADQVDKLRRELRAANARAQLNQEKYDNIKGTGKGHYGRPLKPIEDLRDDNEEDVD